MSNRKRKYRRIRIKSFWRVALSVFILVAVVAAALLIRNFFFKKPTQISAIPTATSSLSVSPTPLATMMNVEVTNVPVPANGAQVPYDDTVKEIAELIAKNNGITVNIINYSRNSGYSEKLRALLEINGFSVSAGNDKALKRVNSAIVEKTEGIPGELIGKLVNIGRVREEFDSNSRFDVVVIIGDDYN